MTGPIALTENPADHRPYPPGVAYVDGQYVEMAHAKISILDWGFLRADATYDVVHVWDGRFFRLGDHLDRFYASAEGLRLTVPYGKAEAAAILHNCVALSGLRRAYVEMVCTRGLSASFSRDPRQAENRFLAFAIPLGSVANEEQMARGLRAHISDRVRIPPGSFDPRIKNYQWLDLVCGMFEAYEADQDVPLLRDLEGNLTEGPGFNLFIVTDGRLATPDEGVLEGITRRTAMEIALAEGMAVEERVVSVEELQAADEAFVTSTAGGIMPLCQVDGQAIGRGVPGPVTGRLKDLYWERHRDSAWSEAVVYRD